jgi:hypothetical protein
VYFGIGLVLALIEALAQSSQLSRIFVQLNKKFAEIFFVALLPPIIFESGTPLAVLCSSAVRA